MTEPAQVFLLLLAAHWVADYPLQGDFLSRAKSEGPLRHYHLLAHSGIHAGAVLLVTASLPLALIEWLVHAIIDEAKVRGRTTFAQDQIAHLTCKVAYVTAIAGGLV